MPAAALAIAALWACAGENNKPGNGSTAVAPPVGTWVIADVVIDPKLPENKALADQSPDGYEMMTGLLVNQSIGRRYEIRQDGSFLKFVPYDSSSVSGTWNQNDDQITFSYKDGDLHRTETYRIASRSDSVLRLVSRDKLTVQYVLTLPVE
jgi:hypothetical protein